MFVRKSIMYGYNAKVILRKPNIFFFKFNIYTHTHTHTYIQDTHMSYFNISIVQLLYTVQRILCCCTLANTRRPVYAIQPTYAQFGSNVHYNDNNVILYNNYILLYFKILFLRACKNRVLRRERRLARPFLKRKTALLYLLWNREI